METGDPNGREADRHSGGMEHSAKLCRASISVESFPIGSAEGVPGSSNA